MSPLRRNVVNPRQVGYPSQPTLRPHRHWNQAPDNRLLCVRPHHLEPILRPTD